MARISREPPAQRPPHAQRPEPHTRAPHPSAVQAGTTTPVWTNCCSIQSLAYLSLVVFIFILQLTNYNNGYSSQQNNSISSINSSNNSNSSRNRNRDAVPFSRPLSTQDSILPKCLRLGFENEMDKLLSNYKLVFVIMPAKAAGSSFKRFTTQCMGERAIGYNNILHLSKKNAEMIESDMRKAGKNNHKLPSLISSHIPDSEAFVNLLHHATEQSLIIYSHRKETSRLRSAIIHVAMRKCIELQTYDTGKCVLDADAVFDFIKKKEFEIHHSGSVILSCKTYEAIESTSSNLVFMNYKQASGVQTLLAKHHNCTAQEALHVNSGTSKKPIFVKVNNNELVEIDSWLDDKMELMGLGLKMELMGLGLEGQVPSCQAKTYKMQRDLFSCPNETLLFSSSSLS